MFKWSIIFFVLALVAGLFGFTGVAVAFAGVGKVFFVIFLVLALISLVTHLVRGHKK